MTNSPAAEGGCACGCGCLLAVILLIAALSSPEGLVVLAILLLGYLIGRASK